MIKNGLIEGKVHMKDIKDGTHPREMPCLVVGDKKFWSPATTRDILATHDDCKVCGVEFEKEYSSSRYCSECEFKVSREKYLAMPYKEWDGICAVCIGDQYFFDPEEVDDYIADQKEFDEDFPDSIDLIICEPVPLRTLDHEYWSDEMHEDWEMSSEMEEAVNALNKVIEAQPTQTWLPSKTRTTYTYSVKEK